MTQDIKNMHKMRKVTIYRSTSRELLLGFKMGTCHDLDLQRPLRRAKDTISGDYTLVVYQQAYAYNIHGHDEYKSVRLTSGTHGRMETRELTRELFRSMMQDIQVHTCPDSLEELDLTAAIIFRLKSNGITGICHLLEHTQREISKFPNIGKTSMTQIVDALAKHKLRLNPF